MFQTPSKGGRSNDGFRSPYTPRIFNPTPFLSPERIMEVNYEMAMHRISTPDVRKDHKDILNLISGYAVRYSYFNRIL